MIYSNKRIIFDDVTNTLCAKVHEIAYIPHARTEKLAEKIKIKTMNIYVTRNKRR